MSLIGGTSTLYTDMIGQVKREQFPKHSIYTEPLSAKNLPRIIALQHTMECQAVECSTCRMYEIGSYALRNVSWTKSAVV